MTSKCPHKGPKQSPVTLSLPMHKMTGKERKDRNFFSSVSAKELFEDVDEKEMVFITVYLV